VARRNPAFRIAIGGLTFAVFLSVVGALALVGHGLVSVTPSEPDPLAQVATTGELGGLLEPTGRRAVPEPVEPAEEVARETSIDDRRVREIPVPSQPDSQTLAREQLARELMELRSQVNEISRAQLEAQIAEIHQAGQLLTQHQTSREVASLEREIEDLKAQIAARDTQVAEQPPEMPTEAVTAAPSEPPLQITPAAENPDRVDVDARDVPLTELLTALGQQKGWNLVTGPEVNGQVTYRWRGVEPESAIRQLLKAHGWQIRIEGEFAVVEPLTETELPPIRVTESTTRTATLPEEHRHNRIPDEAWKPIPKHQPTDSGPSESGLQPPIEAEMPEIEEPRDLAPQVPAGEDLSQAPIPTDETEETPPQELASLPPAPRILPALPSTMTRIFHPKNVSSQKLLPQIRPLLTEHAGEVTASPADAANAGSLLVKDQPQVISRVEELVRELDVPARMVRIEATILQLKVPPPAQPGLFRQALSAIERGPCPQCGVVHGPEESVSIGHSQAGWTEIGGGLSCGTCAMSVEQVVTRLKSHASTTITALAPIDIGDRQLADFALTEQQGFRRQVSMRPGSSEDSEFVAEGLQLRLRPIVQADGSIRLELTPRGPSGEQSGTAQADLPLDHCVVLGGLYFEHQMQITPASARTGSPQQMHEVVVLIRAKARPE
jgi:hypothetical protein